MKWLHIKLTHRRMLGVRTALCCLAWGLIGVISACRAQNACPDQTRFLCTTDTAGKRDTAVSVVRLDSGTVVSLPDSLVRRLAARLGMIDSAEARRYFEADNLLLRENLDTADTRPVLSRYERHRRKRIKGWAKLIPNQSCLQYAGSIGLLSAGLGWHYGRGDHWETELLVGFLPKYKTETAKSNFTLKQRYVPWHCVLGSRWTVEPLTTGFFFNTISGDDFWKNQPDRYPKDYYGFSTKVRTNIFVGQRLRYNIPHSRRIFLQAMSLYYEISTCDLYLISKITNRHYPWSKTLSLAIGLRCEM